MVCTIYKSETIDLQMFYSVCVCGFLIYVHVWIATGGGGWWVAMGGGGPYKELIKVVVFTVQQGIMLKQNIWWF